MAKPMLYLTGEEIKKGDRALLHGEAGIGDYQDLKFISRAPNSH
jgi:hypothetical protein